MCRQGIGQCHLHLSPLLDIGRGCRSANANLCDVSLMDSQVFIFCFSRIFNDFDVEVLGMWLREVEVVRLEFIAVLLQRCAVARPAVLREKTSLGAISPTCMHGMVREQHHAESVCFACTQLESNWRLVALEFLGCWQRRGAARVCVGLRRVKAMDQETIISGRLEDCTL